MEVSNEQKSVLKAIGAKEVTFSQLQRKLGENFPVGAEVQILGQMGLVEEADGYLFVTDVGIKVASIEGNDIPDTLEAEMNASVQKAGAIIIDQPGDAQAKYRKGVGIEEQPESDAKRQYREGRARQQGKPVRQKPSRYEPQSDTTDGDQPEEPLLEAAEENEEPTEIIEVRSQGETACPIFGKASLKFCTAMCAGWDNGCGVTDKMAERLKP